MTPASQKSYAIIGTGAIGGYCAIKLQEAGFDVHCLINRDYEFVQKNGLTIIDDNKTMTLPVKAYDNINKIPQCDVVLITLKSTANHILKNSFCAQGVSDDFKNAGFNSVAAPHLPTLRWKKLAANIPTSGLSVVLDAYYNDLIKNPHGFELLKRLTKEVIVTAKHCGADIPDDFYDFRLKAFEALNKMEKTRPSMKDDYDTGNKLELHAIYGNAIKIAKKYGVSMPLTEMLYLQLLYLSTI